MTRRISALLALLILLTAACSVPTDERATAVAPEDLPPDLQPVVTEAPTTTSPQIGTDVPIYLYNTQSQKLQAVSRTVEKELVDVRDALRQLFIDIPSEEERNDDNLITQLVSETDPDDPESAPQQLELVDAQSGVNNQINIQVRGQFPAQNPARAQAFAQVVFTASELTMPGARPRVLIQNANGRNLDVSTEAEAAISGPISRDDYPGLDPNVVEPPTTTSTASPTTSAPPTTPATTETRRTITIPPATVPTES